ncbi:hypothetical protein SAMN06313486_101100, partial [Epsilonproteobacteria bacterium SCGC AD-308-P11]
GCSSSNEPQAVASKPSWLNEQLVGSARMTASGNTNEQRELALQRAIAELLMLKGEAKGESVAQIEKGLKQSNSKEHYYTNYKSNTSLSIEYKNRPYSVKIKDIFEDTKTGEIFIRVEEID